MFVLLCTCVCVWYLCIWIVYHHTLGENKSGLNRFVERSFERLKIMSICKCFLYTSTLLFIDESRESSLQVSCSQPSVAECCGCGNECLIYHQLCILSVCVFAYIEKLTILWYTRLNELHTHRRVGVRCAWYTYCLNTLSLIQTKYDSKSWFEGERGRSETYRQVEHFLTNQFVWWYDACSYLVNFLQCLRFRSYTHTYTHCEGGNRRSTPTDYDNITTTTNWTNLMMMR